VANGPNIFQMLLVDYALSCSVCTVCLLHSFVVFFPLFSPLGILADRAIYFTFRNFFRV